MFKTRPFRTVVGCVVAAITLAHVASAQAQVSPKFDIDTFEGMDIQDGIPFSWTAVLGANTEISI